MNNSWYKIKKDIEDEIKKSLKNGRIGVVITLLVTILACVGAFFVHTALFIATLIATLIINFIAIKVSTAGKSEYSRYLKHVEKLQTLTKTVKLSEYASFMNMRKGHVINDLRKMQQYNWLVTGISYNSVSDILEIPDPSTLSNDFASEHFSSDNTASSYKPFNYIQSDMKTEAQAMLEQLSIQNNFYGDDEIKKNVFALCEKVNALVAYGEKEPQHQDNIRRFNKKYLLTIVLLIEKYIEMEKTVSGTQMIADTKQEILKGLQELMLAYQQNLENMYSDNALDMSTDITVMSNLLAQDGLSENKM